MTQHIAAEGQRGFTCQSQSIDQRNVCLSGDIPTAWACLESGRRTPESPLSSCKMAVRCPAICADCWEDLSSVSVRMYNQNRWEVYHRGSLATQLVDLVLAVTEEGGVEKFLRDVHQFFLVLALVGQIDGLFVLSHPLQQLVLLFFLLVRHFGDHLHCPGALTPFQQQISH